MRKGVFFMSLFFCFYMYGQKKLTISGYIQDGNSAEKLISATLFDRVNQLGVVTNTYGFYSLTLPEGPVDLFSSYVGYSNWELKFDLSKDTIIDISMTAADLLQEIVIQAEHSDQVNQKIQMSQVSVPIDQIKKAPALLGEVDVLKVLQLLPGVQGGGEGQNGLYVRGGSPDQNLILLDGVPVYNVSHIGGFFSVFNGDAIKNVTLTKGGFPARHGGRLSSIIEIDMKEGNMREFHGEGGIGLISSRLTLEGPIWKDKISFLVSGRRTYLDLIARPFINGAIRKQNQTASTEVNAGLDAHFHDINAKINYKINGKHRLFLSVYNGLDIFGIQYDEFYDNRTSFQKTKGGIDWGNVTSAFRWNWMINPKLFANTTVTYSKYKVNIGAFSEYKLNNEIESNQARYISGIRDWAAKVDFDYIVNPTYRVRFGLGNALHQYTPGAFQVQLKSPGSNLDTILGSKAIRSAEPYTYVENEIQWGVLRANLGLHASAFRVDKQWYTSLQPRVGINYGLNNSMALKASFATMRQYINLLSNERIGLPTDLWVPATGRIKPQDAWQVAIGLAKTFSSEYEFTFETYYKKMKNVVSYTDGASLLDINSDWQDKITQGDGTAYGSEWLVQKKNGKTTGWVGYTLSWNWRQFDDLNRGERYPFKYDRRHDVEILVSHKFSKRFSLSGTWQYGTGNAVSLPSAYYKLPSFNNSADPSGILELDHLSDYDIIDSKNDYRMPAYHRMDINVEFSKQKKHHMRTWSVGAYNLYNRPNPLFLSSDTVGKRLPNGQFEFKKVIRQYSLFPIVPHFMYSFKF